MLARFNRWLFEAALFIVLLAAWQAIFEACVIQAARSASGLPILSTSVDPHRRPHQDHDSSQGEDRAQSLFRFSHGCYVTDRFRWQSIMGSIRSRLPTGLR